MDTELRGLVIGYGRAGRRHGAALDKLGVGWSVFDPFIKQEVGAYFNGATTLELAFVNEYDFAVICTPPSLHLQQIKTCLDAGIPVLCEKPLCGFREQDALQSLLSRFDGGKAMLAYNYHFSPSLASLKRSGEQWQDKKGNWAVFSDQHRPSMPEWGMLLDHLSHSVDILLWLSEATDVKVSRATHHKNDVAESWFVAGELDGQPFNIWDAVRSAPMNKVTWVSGPFGNVDISGYSQGLQPDMTEVMWKVFLSHLKEGQPFPITLRDGARAQEVLEKIQGVSNEG